MDIGKPYLLFLADARDDLAAKTAQGIVDWRPGWCVGQLRLPACTADVGLPDLTPREAGERGARSMIVGVAAAGWVLQGAWSESIVTALEAGLDVASGLHMRLSSLPAVREAAERCGRRLFDARYTDAEFGVGTGAKRPGRRLLTVGTDCSCGKKYTALALERELRDRGVSADFRATGQTGILISGRGVAVDAVVSDFVSGAAEWLTPANDPDHWDVVEGQGSLLHPSYAGVTLGLLHGTQPDAFVVCHEPTRRLMRGISYPMPTPRQCIDVTLSAGRLTSPEIRCVGIAIDTSRLDGAAARELLERTAGELKLPCVDPLRTGVAPSVDLLLRS